MMKRYVKSCFYVLASSMVPADTIASDAAALLELFEPLALHDQQQLDAHFNL